MRYEKIPAWVGDRNHLLVDTREGVSRIVFAFYVEERAAKMAGDQPYFRVFDRRKEKWPGA